MSLMSLQSLLSLGSLGFQPLQKPPHLLRITQPVLGRRLPGLLGHEDPHAAALESLEGIFIREVIAQIKRKHLRAVETQGVEEPRRAWPLSQSRSGRISKSFLPWVLRRPGMAAIASSTARSTRGTSFSSARRK